MSSSRKKVGLALGGGGAKGFAHIGVIKVLEKNNIPIDYIAGTSIGALVGGFYAASKNIALVEQDALRPTLAQMIGLVFEPWKRGGIIGGDKILSFIKQHVGTLSFDELHVPLCVATTDLKKGDAHDIRSGSVAQAIRASIAFPVMLAPQKIKGRLYADGCLTSAVPVDQVRRMGADIVIAVDLDNDYVFSWEDGLSVTRLSLRSVNLVLKSLAQEEVQRADVVINPKVARINSIKDFNKGKQIITIGERAAREKIKDIKKLLHS